MQLYPMNRAKAQAVAARELNGLEPGCCRSPELWNLVAGLLRVRQAPTRDAARVAIGNALQWQFNFVRLGNDAADRALIAEQMPQLLAQYD